MSGDSERIPAGWYPVPGGGNRYWDGEHWLSLPDPSSGSTPGPGSKRLLIGTLAAILVLFIGGGAVFYFKTTHDTDMRNAAIATSSKAAAAKADRLQKEDDEQRAARKQTVTEIEASIKTLAEKQAQAGLFDGPILSVSCDPVGGSTDDLTAKTTVFECFAATTDNGDGTFLGEKYHARQNWDTEEYTYGYGPAQ